jgi:multidrug efflux pump
VIVSGVVALTLSPMMGARILRAGDGERGFAGWINRRFEMVRAGYTRALSATLRYRPVVLTLWLIVASLIVPFYMFSQRELAPAEDQGVVFSVIQAAPNATIERRAVHETVLDVYRSFPETAASSRSPPDRRIRGMVTSRGVSGAKPRSSS